MRNSIGARAVGQSGALPVAVCLMTLAVGACTRGSTAEESARPAQAPRAHVDQMATTVPETTVAETTTTTAEPLPGLQVGSEGPAVLALEQKLALLHFYVGQVDEGFDGDTRDAVLAFQKVSGMDRTGRATDDVVAALQALTTPPPPMVPAGGPNRVEVDLERQVLFLFQANTLNTILNVSTGSNERFCSEGWCRKAVTPPGSFTVYEKRFGWETGPLGSLYNPQYFNGAIAIHGSRSVPAYPASHGCVRISMSAAEWFPDRLTIGMPVYVVSAEEPHPAPIAPNAPPVSTPTTLVPDTPRATVPTSTTTTTMNLLGRLLTPPTTRQP